MFVNVNVLRTSEQWAILFCDLEIERRVFYPPGPRRTAGSDTSVINVQRNCVTLRAPWRPRRVVSGLDEEYASSSREMDTFFQNNFTSVGFWRGMPQKANKRVAVSHTNIWGSCKSTYCTTKYQGVFWLESDPDGIWMGFTVTYLTVGSWSRCILPKRWFIILSIDVPRYCYIFKDASLFIKKGHTETCNPPT